MPASASEWAAGLAACKRGAAVADIAPSPLREDLADGYQVGLNTISAAARAGARRAIEPQIAQPRESFS